MNKATDESALACKDDSLTIQSQAEDTDINVIMKKYAVTGLLPQVPNPPTYGDFEGVDNYQDALHLVMEAQRAFNALDPDVRRRFDYDPGKFVEFAENPANLEECRKLGLAKPINAQGAPGADNSTPPGTPVPGSPPPGKTPPQGGG